MNSPLSISTDLGCRLWVDGAGVYLVWFAEKITIGNAFIDEAKLPKLGLMADLKTQHVEIERTGETYAVTPFGRTVIQDAPVSPAQLLRDKTQIGLGEDVKLEFRIPSVLSCSATIEFISDHRPLERTDRVILFDKTCILDQSTQAHVPCSGMQVPVVLFERDSKLWAKCNEEFAVSQDGQSVHKSSQTVLSHGTMLTGDGWQFRVEAIQTPK